MRMNNSLLTFIKRYLFQTILGLFFATSISFHIGLAQDLSFVNKGIYIVFLAIPIIWLINNLSNLISYRGKTVKIILAVVLSLILTSLTFLNFYQQVPVVKLHKIIIEVPQQQVSKDLTITINQINIKGQITQGILFNSINFSGPADYYKNAYFIFNEGSSINITRQYSGALEVFLKTSTCPALVNTIVDGAERSFDLCAADLQSGLRFNEESTGIVSAKWELIRKAFLLLDIFIAFSIGVLVFMFLFSFKEILIRLRKGKELLQVINNGQFIFFVSSLVIVFFVTILVYEKSIPDLILFSPCILFLVFLQLNITITISVNKRALVLSGVVILLLYGGIINISLRNNIYFFNLNPNFPIRIIDKTNSLNSLVNFIYNDFDYALMYGTGESLFERDLIMPENVYKATNLDLELLKSGLGTNNFKLVPDNFYTVSEADFQCLLEKTHTNWVSGRGDKMLFLDGKYFTSGEPAVLEKYEETYLLFPETFLSIKGFCQ